jgi:hypothetical protein
MKCHLLVLLLVSAALAQHCRQIDIDKSSGFCTVPDPKLTPGALDASLACLSNTVCQMRNHDFLELFETLGLRMHDLRVNRLAV